MNMKRLILCSLFMLSAIVSFAQQLFTSKGVVVDETGETVIGATVQIVGDNKLITVTDTEGRFMLGNVKPGSKMERQLYSGRDCRNGLRRAETFRFHGFGRHRRLEEDGAKAAEQRNEQPER